MKFSKIILLDRSGEYLEECSKRYPNASFVLVAEENIKIKKFLKENSQHILTFIKFDDFPRIQDVTNIDYQVIENMKPYQIDIETMLHRVMLNNPLAKDIYHQHLSFFTKIFRDFEIDLILCSEFNLATPNHLIPFGLGKILGIPTYAVEHLPSCPAISLNNYNFSNRVPFQSPFYDLTSEMLTFYKHRSLQNKPKNFKEKLTKTFGAILVEFIKCLLSKSFERTYLGISYSYWDKFRSFRKLKLLRKAYEKISVTPDLKQKYIYYSIHLEPEATVIGKTLLESQLTMIKMLANSLPPGWKLYVKEHPHQFMLNTSLTHYFLHNVTFFKNVKFYQEIKSLNNTHIVSLDFPTDELIKHAQIISTINGTVTLEAMLQQKPVILFSGKVGLYGVLKNVFHISSYIDLKNAIHKITSNQLKQFEIQTEFEYLKKFIANTQDPNFYSNLFLTIEEHAKTIQPTGEKL